METTISSLQFFIKEEIKANNLVVTQDKLQEFYNIKVYLYLNGSVNLGFTPIGTVISVMLNEAPDNLVSFIVFSYMGLTFIHGKVGVRRLKPLF